MSFQSPNTPSGVFFSTQIYCFIFFNSRSCLQFPRRPCGPSHGCRYSNAVCQDFGGQQRTANQGHHLLHQKDFERLTYLHFRTHYILNTCSLPFLHQCLRNRTFFQLSVTWLFPHWRNIKIIFKFQLYNEVVS